MKNSDLMRLVRRMITAGNSLARVVFLMQIKEQHGQHVRDQVERLYLARGRA